MFILDTNILSTFLKIDRMDLLLDLFGSGSMAITENVIFEINKAIEVGLKTYKPLFELIDRDEIKITHTSKDDIALMQELPRFMGAGERDSFAICKNKGFVLVTDDRRVVRFAKRNNVESISLHMILRALWKLEICTKDELKAVLDLIVTNDRKVIDKDLILNNEYHN